MSPSVHAACVAVGAAGVLIRGASGTGKSALADALVADAVARGGFARLVADDRTHLAAVNGRLLASAPPALAGLIERRGVGLVAIPHLACAVVRLVVDLVDAPDRLPAPESAQAVLETVALPRLAVAARSPLACQIVRAALDSRFSATACDRSALAFAPQHGKLSSSALHAPHLRSDRAGAPRGGHDPERNALCAETA